MSVNEYAIDVNLSVDKIISLCQKLGVQVNNGEDMLDDDAIIMLDNEIANISDEPEENADLANNETLDELEEEDLEIEATREVESNNKSSKKKKGKNTPNNKNNKKNDFLKQRKGSD